MGYKQPDVVIISSESPDTLTEILRKINIKNPGVNTVYVDIVKGSISFDERFNKVAAEYCLEEADRILKLARQRKKSTITEEYREIIYL
ncbi:MAG: hypothetical protein QXL86_03245 [Candidatus Aenigmatarchaeota archaeon]